MVAVRFFMTGATVSVVLCSTTLALAFGSDRSGDPDIPANPTFPEPHYYVAPGGNDSGAGTEADPWGTLSPVKSLKSGTAYLQRGGTWTGGMSVSGIAISAYGEGALPVISGDGSGGGFGGGVSVNSNAVLDSVKVDGTGRIGITISGSGSVVSNCEIDGRSGTFELGFGVMGDGNLIIGNNVHHLSAQSGDSGDMNTSGGAEAYMIMGSNNEIAYNIASEAHGKNETLGGEEGGCLEIVNGQAGSTIENVYFHHNYCERSIGLFEGCSGNFQGTDKIQENHGIIKDSYVAYNLSVDAMWLYLLQPVNTDFVNLVFEHNTLVHTPKNDSDFTQAARNSFGLCVEDDAGYTGVLEPGEITVRNNLFWVTEGSAGGFGGGFMGTVPTQDHYNNVFANFSPGWTLGEGEIEVDDPGLTADYRLAAGSPAIDKGSTKAYQVWTDFDGNAVPLGTAPDMGASEFCEGDNCQTPSAVTETGGAPSTEGTGGASGGDTTTSGGAPAETGGAAPGETPDTTTSTGGTPATATGGAPAEPTVTDNGALTCSDGLTLCGDKCYDLNKDSNNCGVCGNVCLGGQSCQAGECTAVATCQAPLTECAGACVDLRSDGNNCNACGHVCPAGQLCSAGVCTATCADGQTPCGQSCVSLATDILNCGACGKACQAGQLCTDGQCTGEATGDDVTKPGLQPPPPSAEPVTSGCACSVVAPRDARLGAMLSALLGLVLLGRRRQRRS